MNFIHISTALSKNNYPKHLIQRQLCHRPPNTASKDQECTSTVVLPYVKCVSEAIRRVLREVDIRVVYRLHTMLKQLLVHPKDPIDLEKKTNVVTESHVHRVQQVVTLDKHRVHLTPDLRSTRRLWRKVIRVHLQWLNMCGCRGIRWISRIPQSLPRKQIAISDVIWNLGLFSATTQLTVSWDRYPQYISASFQNKFHFFNYFCFI